MIFAEYITKNNKKLRLGYTTGTCAALASKAACEMLLAQKKLKDISIITPKGMEVSVSVYDTEFSFYESSCCVIKDGGDDIDATNGAKIYARVKKIVSGITIDGAEGVGRVTRRGLDQPVGSAAINTVPRKMIENAVLEIAKKYGYQGGFEVIISVPEGAEIAKKTFNEGLGILGGISIIGTSGIVEPQSLQAISDTIRAEMRMLYENGTDSLVVTPGNYGETFLAKIKGIESFPSIKCSNFIGDTLDYGLEFGYKKMLFIGHAGKLIKIAGGIMNTHSSFADGRMEIISAHTALFSSKPIERIMNAVTVDEAIEILDEFGLKEAVFESIIGKIEHHLNKRTHGLLETGAIVFSNAYGVLAMGKRGEKLLFDFGGKYNEG